MTGQILDYSLQEHSGVISGSDNVRYISTDRIGEVTIRPLVE